LSLRLTYKISEIPFKPETVQVVREVYGIDIGRAKTCAVLVTFKTNEGWTRLERMTYDTGAVVSLLPFRYFSILGVRKFAPIKLSGISPEAEVPARLTKTTLRLIDIMGRASPEIEAWITIAERDDVPRVLGLKDILETHRLTVDSRRNMFYLDFY